MPGFDWPGFGHHRLTMNRGARPLAIGGFLAQYCRKRPVPKTLARTGKKQKRNG
jgi:hypothetical protein